MHPKELIGSKATLDLSVGNSTEVTISNKKPVSIVRIRNFSELSA